MKHWKASWLQALTVGLEHSMTRVDSNLAVYIATDLIACKCML